MESDEEFSLCDISISIAVFVAQRIWINLRVYIDNTTTQTAREQWSEEEESCGVSISNQRTCMEVSGHLQE